jgi:hypothetical protein
MERLVFSLAAELKSRRMEDEVVFLRRLYAERRQRRSSWNARDEVTAIELACMVGLAPFEGVFLQHPRHFRCSCWGKDRDRGRPQTKVFPPSSTSPSLTANCCRTCGALWVVSGEP